MNFRVHQMVRRSFLRGVAAAFVLLTAATLASAQGAGQGGERWVGTWGTAPVARAGGAPVTGNQTLRQVAHVSLGGERVRVIFSNAFGTRPLQIGAASVALRDRDATIVRNSSRPLSFSGRPTVEVPAGAVMMSDPVDLQLPALTDLAIDLFLPGNLAQSTQSSHGSAFQTNFVSESGNHVGEVDFPTAATTRSSFFLSSVEVAASPRGGAVVAFGDSITDGTRSTPDTNSRWPDFLARRLVSARIEVGVLNVGIAGNRVLGDGAGMSALARFDRDALALGGVQAVILLEGINDINLARNSGSPNAQDIITGYRQLIQRAHAKGVKVFGATLTPFENVGAQGEATRSALNQFIRTSGEFDGVVDFDAAVRDPARPTRILPRFDPGDGLHMNDQGYEAMGGAIDLALFGAGASAAAVGAR